MAIQLPLIEKVRFDNFDLYSRMPNVALDTHEPVICLIGANGLGKSTFLNALAYALTGAVPDLERAFKSADDYAKNNSRANRIDDYFSGRLSAAAQDIATITVVLRWGESTLHVTREVMADHLVTELIHRDRDGVGRDILEDLGADDGRAAYEAQICKITGLSNFAQFVFLIHFVCLFDEGRHLLMWDEVALTNALYLAFGTDPRKAREADRIRNDMNREASRARNKRFSARHITEQIDQLRAVFGQDQDFQTEDELAARHAHLTDAIDTALGDVQRLEKSLRDADLRWADLSASLTELQIEYRKAFSSRLGASSPPARHPLIRTTLGDDRCAVCSTPGVAGAVQAAIDECQCPLCGSSVSPLQDDDAIKALQSLDENIARVRTDLTATLGERDRVTARLATARETEKAAENELREFEDGNEGLQFTRPKERGRLDEEIRRLDQERTALIDQSKAHYAKRDEHRDALREYERELGEQYESAAERFVPRFRELAEEFIGLPIEISLENRAGANEAGFGLEMRMNDQLRMQAESVSESQRFFLDIALRMALSEMITDGPATLMIDTPEGSLDITYEARAGAMFSRFVAEKNRLLVTANLRSSELVRRLANLQTNKRMKLARMTEWTDLSEVQQAEERLFIDAYEDIEKALLP